MKTQKDTKKEEMTETEPKVAEIKRDEPEIEAPSNSTSSRADAIEAAQDKDLKSQFEFDLNAVPDWVKARKEEQKKNA